MNEDIRVRIATPNDFSAVMNLAMMVASENGIFEPDMNMVIADIWPALNGHKGLVGVIGAPGEDLQGFVLLRIGNLWYSPAEIIEEKTVFVAPKYRSAKGGRARKLCEFSKKVADELEMPLIIGVVSNHRTKGKEGLYNRLFGPPAGAFWLYGAKTGTWGDSASRSQSVGEN
jgi:hypothetical protein